MLMLVAPYFALIFILDFSISSLSVSSVINKNQAEGVMVVLNRGVY